MFELLLVKAGFSLLDSAYLVEVYDYIDNEKQVSEFDSSDFFKLVTKFKDVDKFKSTLIKDADVSLMVEHGIYLPTPQKRNGIYLKKKDNRYKVTYKGVDKFGNPIKRVVYNWANSNCANFEEILND